MGVLAVSAPTEAEAELTVSRTVELGSCSFVAKLRYPPGYLPSCGWRLFHHLDKVERNLLELELWHGLKKEAGSVSRLCHCFAALVGS